MDDAVDDFICEGFHVPVISGTSALSFELLCKLNDGLMRKDFDYNKITEQFRTIAEQFRTKLFCKNFNHRSFCCNAKHLLNEKKILRTRNSTPLL